MFVIGYSKRYCCGDDLIRHIDRKPINPDIYRKYL